MATSKVTFVTGTAEVRRREPSQQGHYREQPHTEQHLTTEPNRPQQVNFIDGKCTCCPYGYHIDLDFLNFCRDMESGSTLQNLKRIQKTKRKLRKSMEVMLDEQGGMMTSESHSAPPEVVHSTEAGRLMHMINYERSATHRILNQIDSSVNTTIGHLEEGRGRRYLSSDSDDPVTPNMPYGSTPRSFDESGVTPSSFASGRTDSLSSLSSVSTVSSEAPMMYQAQMYHHQQMHHHQHTKTQSKTTKVVENPVIEMATAEMKHYSSHSSAQLVNNGVDEPDFSPRSITPERTPPFQSPSPRASPDVNQMSLQSVREAMAVSLQRLRELEEQVKAIPILQVRISVLKEEKRLLNLQLKASKTNSNMNMRSIGVGDARVDFDERNKAMGSPQVKSPPPTLPKPARTVSVGIGDHSVIEPYLAQPDLPTGYTIRENETHTEIQTTSILEKETFLRSKVTTPSLNMSFRSPSYEEKHSRSLSSSSSSAEGQPRFTINQIQRSSPKALTRTIGIGDGNVFEGSGLHVHEKEMRTVIIGQGANVAKRNVGIECRVPTRDVGVSFMCDEEKPQTRTVGVNVNYDTSGILTSLDFKGETELRMALRGVLQRNVRSVGTNCNYRMATSDVAVATEFNGVSVGCGDEQHRVDVEIRPMISRKSVAVGAKPDTGTKCISTEKGWAMDASTNTVMIDKYSKSTMTDRPRQVYASSNTEPVLTRPASNQTEVKMFQALDQIKTVSTNTQKVITYSTGICTDIASQRSIGVNTIDRGDTSIQEAPKHSSPQMVDRGVGDGRVDIALDEYLVSEDASLTKKSVLVEEQIIQKGASQANAFLTDFRSPSSEAESKDQYRMGSEHSSQYNSYEMTKNSTAPIMHEFSNTYESRLKDESHDVSRGSANLDKSYLISQETSSEKSPMDSPSQFTSYEITRRSSAPAKHEYNSSIYNSRLTGNSQDLNRRNLDLEESSSTSQTSAVSGSSSLESPSQYTSYELTRRSYPIKQESNRRAYESRLKNNNLDGKRESSSKRENSPSKEEDSFHETITEHYVITKEGKQLISEEKMKSVTSGGKTTNSKSKIYGPAADRYSSSETAEISESSSDFSSSFSGGRAGRSSNLNEISVDSTTKSSYVDNTDSGNKYQRQTFSSSSSSPIVTNPYRTLQNLAEVSSLIDSESSQSTSSSFREVSKTCSDSNLSKDVSKFSGSSSGNAKSLETIYDIRRAGSVEDFMPDDIRRYMSIDPSTSKDSGFGEELHQKFAEDSSSSPGGARCMKMSKTVTKRRTLKSGDKVSVKETRTVEGPDGKTVTTYSERTNEGDGDTTADAVSSKPESEHIESLSEKEKIALSQAMHSSTSSYSSSLSSGYVGGGSDTNLASSSYSEHSLSDFSAHSRSSPGGIMSVSETTVSTIGDDDMKVTRSEAANYGSLDRKTGKLKSIMKHAKSDSERLSGKKGITFAESVMGGTGSSSDGNSSDSDSTSSYEEGSYDSREGEVSFQCQDDEAIAQGLPGAQMFDQNIRETYELSNEMRQACDVLATYLIDSTTITTKQLNASTNVVQQEWFRVSSHKLSSPHQVEDYLSSVNEISKRLLEYIVNMTDANGNTAIHYCISHCNFEIASLLLDSEVCDMNKQNKAGYTPIMLAGLASVQNEEQRDLIRRLFSRGDINARATATQQTALMLAASHGRTEMVRLLVEEGADYNLQDVDGSTALMCACEHGHLDIVTFLLAQPDINAEATDNENCTALTIAMEADHKDVGVVLYKHLNFSKISSPFLNRRKF